MQEKYEDEILQEAEADGKYFCTKDKVHVQQRKRKRGQDPCIKGRDEKFPGGISSGLQLLLLPEGLL